ELLAVAALGIERLVEVVRPKLAAALLLTRPRARRLALAHVVVRARRAGNLLRHIRLSCVPTSVERGVFHPPREFGRDVFLTHPRAPRRLRAPCRAPRRARSARAVCRRAICGA